MNIVVLESYAANAVARLQAENGFKISQDSSRLSEAEVLLIRSRTKIDEHFLKQAPQLKLVISSTSGFDHIDWRECTKRGITAAHTPDANAQSTAELTLTLILAVERQLLAARKNVRENRWRDGLPRPAGLEGQDLGVIGLGRVGRRVAKLGQAFGMRVTAYDPYVEDDVFKSMQYRAFKLD